MTDSFFFGIIKAAVSIVVIACAIAVVKGLFCFVVGYTCG